MIHATDRLLIVTEIAPSRAIIKCSLTVHMDLISLDCGHFQHFFLLGSASFISFFDQSLSFLIFVNELLVTAITVNII